MTDLSCSDYTEKSIVVRGDTKEHKEQLKKLGGKYNANLRDGPGWIFTKKVEDKVLAYIASGKLDKEEEKKVPQKKVATDVLSTVETALKNMDIKERLTFIATITRMASSQPYVQNQEEEETYKPIVKVLKKDTDKRLVISSDVEDSDDEDIAPKSLLRR